MLQLGNCLNVVLRRILSGSARQWIVHGLLLEIILEILRPRERPLRMTRYASLKPGDPVTMACYDQARCLWYAFCGRVCELALPWLASSGPASNRTSAA